MAFPGGFKEYMAVKRQKLEVQAEAIAAKSSQSEIFAGVILYFNGFLGSVGLTMLEMKELVLIHGAMVRDKLEGEVTHIIASQMTDSKMIQLRKPVVRPEWLTESINAGRQLPWNPYRLYTNLEASQKTLNAFMTDKASPQKPSSGSPAVAGKSASPNYVISASQVDMNVVNELPEELRKEIMAEVARARTASSSTWRSPSTPKRKKKFSPKRDFFPSVSQVDREVWNAIPASLQRDVLVDMKLVHDQKRLPKSNFPPGMLDASSVEESPVPMFPQHGPSLGGESDVKEIRAMLLSWVEGYPDGPPAEDVSAVVAFLTQLIRDLQMDVAQNLLAWLRVNVLKRYDLTTDGPWCVILNEISSEVDKAVQHGYGCSLKEM